MKEEVIRWDLNGTYTNDIIAEGVKKSLNNKDPMKPTLTFLSLQAVHSPLQAPENYIEMYRHIKDKKRRNYNAMTTAMDDMIGDVVKTYKDLARFRMTLLTIVLSQRIYELCIETIKGLWDNTILIFSSDNGGKSKEGGYNTPLRGEKGSLYEGGIKSIGIINSPLLPR